MSLENFKKQAQLLVRWHRERNYSVGGKIRQLPRYEALTDAEALALPFHSMKPRKSSRWSKATTVGRNSGRA